MLKAEKAVLDIHNVALDSSSVYRLEGEWGIYWKQIVNKNDSSLKMEYIQVPSSWSDQKASIPLEKEGYATYQLTILLPPGEHDLGIYIPPTNSAVKVFVNEDLLTEFGTIGVSGPEEIPVENVALKYFSAVGEVRIIVQNSNFHHRTGGIRKEFFIGSQEAMSFWQKKEMFTDFFLIGCLSIIGFYHVILYLLRRKDISPLYFSFLSLDIAFRTLLTGQLYFSQFFPGIGWEYIKKLEYFTFFIGPALLILFLGAAFPVEFPKVIRRIIIFISLVFTSSLMMGAKYFSQLLLYFQFFAAFLIIYSVYRLIIAYKSKREGARSILIGMLIFFCTVINDIMYNRGLIHTGIMVHWGLFFYIFSQSYVIAFRFSNAFFRAESLSENLQKTNIAYSRFVPSEFLNFLNKASIIDINLGDQMQRDMTILFSDIRSFTQLSETMSPEENFNFLNSYLKRVGPIIRKHNGFIDKYIGDGIMALFPNHPKDAVDCAIEMQEEIRRYNNFRTKSGYDPIRVGIGIHTGKMILGTIGENERMEGSVISDAVNLASRLEGLTKFYGSYILISEELFEKMENGQDYIYRKLGKVRVKGKKEAVTVIEILNGQPTFAKDLFESTKDDFSMALESYMLRNFDKAAYYFNKVISVNSMDSTAKFYLQRSETFSRTGVGFEWEGIEEMTDK